MLSAPVWRRGHLGLGLGLTRPKQYHFVKFDSAIQAKRRQFADSAEQRNLQRVQGELQDVQDVMRRSIAEVLQRGDRLEDVSQLSSRIASESKKYARNANQLNIQLLWHQYGPLAIVALVVVLFVYIRWFWL